MFLWEGLHQACIRNHSGAVKDLKIGRNERIYVYFEVIMFFRKDPPQTEGRRHMHHKIKLPPVGEVYLSFYLYTETVCRSFWFSNPAFNEWECGDRMVPYFHRDIAQQRVKVAVLVGHDVHIITILEWINQNGVNQPKWSGSTKMEVASVGVPARAAAPTESPRRI